MVVLACGVLVVAATAGAGQIPSGINRADYSAADDNKSVQPVSYTTGSGGHELKWLPYRPAKSAAAPAARQPRAASDAAAVRTVQAVESAPPANGAMTDPFGDRGAQMPSPPALLSDNALQGAQPAGSPSDLMQAPLMPPGPARSPKAATPPPASPMPHAAAPRSKAAAQAPATRTPAPNASQPGADSAPVEVPTLEQELAIAPQTKKQECPSPKDLKSIRDIDYKTAPEPGEFPTECSLGNERFTPRSWPCVTFTWKASSLCHKPLYFEEVQAERYGHTLGPCLQPLVSAGHFFLTIPILPYEMGVYPPNECMYTLGYYRPGDCAPYLLDPFPVSLRGALFEGAAVTGLVFFLP